MKCKRLIPILILLFAFSIPLSHETVYYHANTYIFTFPTYGTSMAFSTDMVFTQAYRLNDYWYFSTVSVTDQYGFRLQQSSGTGAKLLITDFFFSSNDLLKFSVTASSGITTTTKIYIPTKGEPSAVYGATSYSYDAGTRIETISIVHASTVAIEVHWTPGTDTTPPTYSDVAHNSTVAGEPCEFSSKWQDNVNLNGYYFCHNISGSWANETWTTFSTNPDWANKTLTLPTSGTVVGYQWFASDTSSNWQATPIYMLTTTEVGMSTVVLLNTPSNGTTINSVNVTFTYQPIFAEEIQNASLWVGSGATWQAVAWNTSTVENSTLNAIDYTFTETGTYLWNVAVYNSSMPIFAEFNRTLIIVLGPWWDTIGVTSTTVGSLAVFYSLWHAEDGLSGYIFSWTASGDWVNDTWINPWPWSTNPTSVYANTDKTLPLTVGMIIYYRTYVNDTNNLWNVTSIKFLVTTAAPPPPPTPTLNTDNWVIYVGSGDSLGIGSYGDYYILIEVKDGILNSSSNSFVINEYNGHLKFNSNQAGSLQISSPEPTLLVTVLGASYFRDSETGFYHADYSSGRNITIAWSFRVTIPPLFPIGFMLGMVGIVGMFTGPAYAVFKVKKGEYRSGLVNGLIWTVIGLALFIAWLGA